MRTSIGTSMMDIAHRRHGLSAGFFLPRNHADTSERLLIALSPHTYSTECSLVKRKDEIDRQSIDKIDLRHAPDEIKSDSGR